MTGEDQARRWLDAVDDLRHARYAEEGGFFPQACFSAQQAAEKAVKAVHYARGARAVLGHSVRNLIERLDPGVPELDDLLDDARELDLNYIPTRYPNGLDAWTPAAGVRRTTGGQDYRWRICDRDLGTTVSLSRLMGLK